MAARGMAIATHEFEASSGEREFDVREFPSVKVEVPVEVVENLDGIVDPSRGRSRQRPINGASRPNESHARIRSRGLSGRDRGERRVVTTTSIVLGSESVDQAPNITRRSQSTGARCTGRWARAFPRP